MLARILRSQTATSAIRSATVSSGGIIGRIGGTRTSRTISSTPTPSQAMKPGTPIAGLDFMKNTKEVVSKERSEYPDWVNSLSEPDITLGKLKKMDIWSLDEKKQHRYLKLTRRTKIKADNIDAGVR